MKANVRNAFAAYVVRDARQHNYLVVEFVGGNSHGRSQPARKTERAGMLAESLKRKKGERVKSSLRSVVKVVPFCREGDSGCKDCTTELTDQEAKKIRQAVGLSILPLSTLVRGGRGAGGKVVSKGDRGIPLYDPLGFPARDIEVSSTGALTVYRETPGRVVTIYPNGRCDIIESGTYTFATMSVQFRRPGA